MKFVIKLVCLVIVGVLTLQLWAGEAAEIITVVASGVGKTEDAALKQAFSNAVTQVVGTIIDAETMVQNDKVIKEQILTYSNAIVTKYEPVGKPVTADGFVAVTIKAQVEKRILTEKLTNNKVISTKVEGKDLMAQALTELKEEQDGAKMIEKLFAALPCIIHAEAYGEPKIEDKTNDNVTLNIRVACSVDEKKYAEWVKAAKPILQKMAIRTTRDRWSKELIEKKDNKELYGYKNDLIKNWGVKENNRSRNMGCLLPIEDIQGGKICYIERIENDLYPSYTAYNKTDERALVIHDNPGMANGSYTVYYIKKDLFEAANKSINMPEHEVMLCDKSGEELAGVKVALNSDGKRTVGIIGENSGTRHISPNAFIYYGFDIYYMAPRYVVELKIELPIDKLKEVKSVNVKAMETKSDSK